MKTKLVKVQVFSGNRVKYIKKKFKCWTKPRFKGLGYRKTKEGWYSLTHIGSGMKIGEYFPTKKKMKRFMKTLPKYSFEQDAETLVKKNIMIILNHRRML